VTPLVHALVPCTHGATPSIAPVHASHGLPMHARKNPCITVHAFVDGRHEKDRDPTGRGIGPSQQFIRAHVRARVPQLIYS
jgi:hypothetical protein